MKSDLTASLAAAVCLHAALLIGIGAGTFAVPQPITTDSDPVNVSFIDFPPAPTGPPPAVPSEPAQSLPTEPQSTPVPAQPPTPVPDMLIPFPAPPASRDILPVSNAPVTPGVSRRVHTRVPHTAPGRAATLAHGGGGSGGPGAPAHSLNNPRPVYPELARRMHQQGVVLLEVLVSVAGTPDNISVARGSGYPLLDRAAVEAVRHWTFQPARSAGLAVASHIELPVRFSLEE